MTHKEKIQELTKELPPVARAYMQSIEQTASVNTRLNYAYDLRTFFGWLNETIGHHEFTLLTTRDIERYISYVSAYTSNTGKQQSNSNTGKARKLAVLKAFFGYLYRSGIVPANIAEKIETPKIPEKEITYLTRDEVGLLLGHIEQQDRAHAIRDMAIVTLFLGTGIRISELCGLDTTDVYMAGRSITVVRKGGARVTLYFGEEVETALKAYMRKRSYMFVRKEDRNALFLSQQGGRLTQRGLQKVLDRYNRAVFPNKRITAHKLRSTYATMLHTATKDIYLVADVIGNKDVNTTRRHYAAIEDGHRKTAAQSLVLRQKEGSE